MSDANARIRELLARPEAKDLVNWLREQQISTVQSLGVAADSPSIYRLQGRLTILNALLQFTLPAPDVRT